MVEALLDRLRRRCHIAMPPLRVGFFWAEFVLDRLRRKP